MHKFVISLAAVLMLSASSHIARGEAETFDWDQWRHLPVQEGGRHKPFGTLAWETLRTISNRAGFPDPDSGQQLDANTLYLVMLFDWKGWDRPVNLETFSGRHSRGSYFSLHEPDKWDRAPLLRVDFLALRSALGLPTDEKYVTPFDLSRSKVRVPDGNQERPFLRWAESLIPKQAQGLTEFEKKSLELADKFWSYQGHRMGNRMEVIPVQGSNEGEWVTVAYLMRADFDDATDPTGKMRKAQRLLQEVRAAYYSSSAGEFNDASGSFIATVRQLGSQLGAYPPQSIVDLEVAYNRWVPFRFAWVFTVLAFLCLLLHMGTGWKPLYSAAWVAFVAGLMAMIVGFGMRVTISGRAPVTNMYESVIYVALGVMVFGLVFELIYRSRYVLTAAAAVATVALILADNCPAALDSSLRPLQPVLRSNFWLVTHVMTITLSYAALALALGVGNITLGYFLVRSDNRQAINSLTNFTYKAIQVGVLLLAAGTILGGVWADYSWGRFWGWDPKEVWALVALLGYLAVLHARYAGWVRQFGLAALSVTCFSLVVMAWYGVNFVLGAGLHSYGFGGGGQTYMLCAIGLQLTFVAVAGLRAFNRGPLFAAGQVSAIAE
ncbi:MAG: cytochrome c biogenesis protein CcsA [Planctomycetota bacterium]|nr:cytochrome c biogenesis protein CcsA [Planctomycetota bacterium]